MEKPRISRLTTIVTILKSKSLVTARELAEKFDVSTRTIYRDIRTLENSGIPIITEEGLGFTLMEGYKMPPVAFTEKEALALITAEQLIIRNKDESLIEHYGTAMTKIKSVLRNSSKNRAELLSQRIVFRNNRENYKTSTLVVDLQIAITNYQLIRITYHSLENNTTIRHVEPFAIYSTQDNWLLIGFCRLRNAFRKFRVDCIKDMRLLNETFDSHNMTLQEFFNEFG